MEEPEKILERIMNFEQEYTPKFTNLIKQSLVDNVTLDIEYDVDADHFPQLPDTQTSDTQSSNTSNNDNIAVPMSSFQPSHQQPSLKESQSQPVPNAMPSYQANARNRKTAHRHKETPIIQLGASQNSIKLIDQNSFIIADDLRYESDDDEEADRDDSAKQDESAAANKEEEDQYTTKPPTIDDRLQPATTPPLEYTQNCQDPFADAVNGAVPAEQNQDEDDDEDGGGGSVKRYSSEEDSASEEEEPSDPLVEEYESVSHEIHRCKLRLRKLDRQMTMAQRQGTSQSNLVKQHSEVKIKIAELLSKRRQLESHEVVRRFIRENEDDTVEITGSKGLNEVINNEKQSFMDDGGLVEINENEEEEDEEIKNHNISPFATSAVTTDSESDMNVDDNQLQGFLQGLQGYSNDDRSRTTSSTMNDFDYSYDAEVVVKPDGDEEETGSVKLNSDEEEDDEDGGGSVQLHSSAEEDEEEEEDIDEDESGGSMQIKEDVEQSENWAQEAEENEDGGYEDEDDESNGGGSVQLNETENTENWVNEDFDTKSMEIHDSDEEQEQAAEAEEEEEDEEEEDDDDEIKEEEKRHKLEPTQHDESAPPQTEEAEQAVRNRLSRSGSGRDRRLRQMRAHRSYKEYGHGDHDTDVTDLNRLRAKYQDRRRHRETMELLENKDQFSLDDLIKPDADEQAVQIPRGEEDQEQNNSQRKPERKTDEHQVHEVEEEEDEEEEPDHDENQFDYDTPQIMMGAKRKSVLLDIDKFASNLPAVIEEDDDDEDDDERNFQAVQYETDSDCDSNDSVVVKKEIITNVTVNDIQFDSV
eukprot:CAMPEP_0197037548 /NCGR_PEP_ID=MMETSP1384-20130603/14729_1 /TAXON_ID=29189 /ORGANISM="Ammonia sp." /LENGTH=811 /DNA_ID=CAMNT_0042467863 /DNA_START=124 /DNA_END=2559 /DNA_ORIENTATION=+